MSMVAILASRKGFLVGTGRYVSDELVQLLLAISPDAPRSPLAADAPIANIILPPPRQPGPLEPLGDLLRSVVIASSAFGVGGLALGNMIGSRFKDVDVNFSVFGRKKV